MRAANEKCKVSLHGQLGNTYADIGKHLYGQNRLAYMDSRSKYLRPVHIFQSKVILDFGSFAPLKSPAVLGAECL